MGCKKKKYRMVYGVSSLFPKRPEKVVYNVETQHCTVQYSMTGVHMGNLSEFATIRFKVLLQYLKTSPPPL